ADPFPRKNAPWERLLEVARLAAPDPAWGDPVRQAATRRNKAACEELARKAAVAKLSPQMLHLVAYLLNDRQARLSWLRPAQARLPNDFWLNFVLANTLSFTIPPGSSAPDALEACGFYRAAIAVRPNSSAAYYNLGNTFRKLNRLDDAIDAWQKSIDLDPKH